MAKQTSKDFLKDGLTRVEAGKRLEKFGLNEIERKQESSWLKLLFDQFKSPLIYILVIAGIITLVLGEWTDSVVIFLAVLVNTILGFFQETKAEKSLIALRKLIVPKAYVVRDGQEQQIETCQIIPGDLVVLKTGGKIPADGILVQTVDLHVNEAILTGESVPVSKFKIPQHHSMRGRQNEKLKNEIKNSEFNEFEEKNRVYMGTVVVSGWGKMLVLKTGMQTRMGKIAGGLQETIEEETPLKKKIAHFSKTLTIIFSVICVLILFEGLLRGRHFLEMFELSVAVAVASIPEGLVISMTVILTLGMQRLLKQKALVRKLLAAETLGGVTVICADKTGTLTKGKMSVTNWAVEGGKSREAEMVKAMVLCNNRINPLEIAMWEAVKKRQSQGWIERVLGENKRVEEIPFSSKNKFIAALYKNKLIISGAPEKVLSLADLSKDKKESWQRKLNKLTCQGLRVVGFTTANSKDSVVLHKEFNKLKNIDSKTIESLGTLGGLRFLGLLAFEDPVREEVKGALEACRKAGIKIKVITGDYKETARAVINKLGIMGKKFRPKNGQPMAEKIEEVIEGYELERMTDQQLAERIDKVILFARTNPEDKIRIVRALKEKGEVVAMMGDGVNDALALKQADIGVVVGEASEVAKETADMVLLDSNFKTIVKAVNEGRAIFENIRKVVLYLLSDSFTEVILISASLIFGTPIPLTAVQILWVNLIEDGLPGIALAFEPEEEGLMKEPPRNIKESILNKEVKVLIFVIGIFTDFLLLGLFFFLLSTGMDLGKVRTIIFAGLAIDSLLYIFSCKTLRKNLWHENLFSNKFLNLSIVVGFVMLFVGIYLPFFQKLLDTQPLSFDNWVLIFSLGIVNIGAIETVKWLFLRKERGDF